MQADIQLIMKRHQRLFADPRRIALLQQIKQTGSISQGARLAGISYKSAWDAINEMNQLADKPLVDRITGGKGGGGAILTPYGERLIQLYHLLETIQQKAFDVLQDEHQESDSLLASIARFSLQTSARNQLFGTVISQQSDAIQPHIVVQLADSHTQLTAALTRFSAERLELTPGKDVQVLIKAPWIGITTHPETVLHYDNQLTGQISEIQQGDQQSEVIIRLTAGQQLCATLNTEDLARQHLMTGTFVTAFFNAEHLIIATLC